MGALRDYLEAQADLGGDEVILPQPWTKSQGAASGAKAAPLGSKVPGKPAKVAGAGSKSDATESKVAGAAAAPAEPKAGVTRRVPEPYATEEFSPLKILTDSLRKDSAPASAGPAAARAVESPAPAIPAFANLDAFWKHVEGNIAALHGPESSGLVLGGGPPFAPLALVGLSPSAEDAAAGKMFQGAAGELLAKMMKAIRLEMPGLYLTCVVKTKTQRAWSRREVTRLLPWLQAELALAQAPVTLLLGEACAQAVLKTGKGLEEMRKEIHAAEGRLFAVTYHPDDLLRKEELKRKAWEDLQWLQTKLSAR